MHILTGLIVGSLLGVGKENQAPSHLSLIGALELHHFLPGRLRYYVPGLKDEYRKCRDIEIQMHRIEGIRNVYLNALTGSLLIEYDPHLIQPEFLFNILIELLGLQEELDRTPIPLIQRELQSFGKAINRAVFEKSAGIIDLKTLLPLTMMVVGIRSIMTYGFQYPSGLTLIWWAYHSLQNGGGSSD